MPYSYKKVVANLMKRGMSQMEAENRARKRFAQTHGGQMPPTNESIERYNEILEGFFSNVFSKAKELMGRKTQVAGAEKRQFNRQQKVMQHTGAISAGTMKDVDVPAIIRKTAQAPNLSPKEVAQGRKYGALPNTLAKSLPPRPFASAPKGGHWSSESGLHITSGHEKTPSPGQEAGAKAYLAHKAIVQQHLDRTDLYKHQSYPKHDDAGKAVADKQNVVATASALRANKPVVMKYNVTKHAMESLTSLVKNFLTEVNPNDRLQDPEVRNAVAAELKTIRGTKRVSGTIENPGSGGRKIPAQNITFAHSEKRSKAREAIAKKEGKGHSLAEPPSSPRVLAAKVAVRNRAADTLANYPTSSTPHGQELIRNLLTGAHEAKRRVPSERRAMLKAGIIKTNANVMTPSGHEAFGKAKRANELSALGAKAALRPAAERHKPSSERGEAPAPVNYGIQAGNLRMANETDAERAAALPSTRIVGGAKPLRRVGPQQIPHVQPSDSEVGPRNHPPRDPSSEPAGERTPITVKTTAKNQTDTSFDFVHKALGKNKEAEVLGNRASDLKRKSAILTKHINKRWERAKQAGDKGLANPESIKLSLTKLPMDTETSASEKGIEQSAAGLSPVKRAKALAGAAAHVEKARQLRKGKSVAQADRLSGVVRS